MASQNVDPMTSVPANNRRKESTKPAVEKETVIKSQRGLEKVQSFLPIWLHQELMELMMNPPKGISAFPDGDNIFLWKATVEGSTDSMYEGLHYKLSMTFPANYSFAAPKVKFITPCFHPNIDTDGNICLDILKEQWLPSYDVRSILLSIQGLLAEPNNDSPLNLSAAQLWENQAAFRKTLHEKYEVEAKRRDK